MLTVAEARARMLAAVTPLGAETVSLVEGLGRVLAADVTARRDQPPQAVSAMDGYAVRAADLASAPASLTVIEEIAAGDPQGAGSGRALGPGETARIFTGAPLPPGADAIVIQENTRPDGDRVMMDEAVKPGRYVRPQGLDFKAGWLGLERGRRLTARDIGLAAAMNQPWLRVQRRPRVAILATGNEVVMPGEPMALNQIASSNGLALAAFVTARGGEPLNLGIAPDESDALGAFIAGAEGADLLVTTGGASVGKHDLVRQTLADRGMTLDFWKIAMRPGKPLIFGRIAKTPLLGLPGNPVSSLVCSTLFLAPLMEALLGRDPAGVPASAKAVLTAPLGENDERQDYLRATLSPGDGDLPQVTAFARQDSSMLGTLSHSDALILRAPHAPPLAAGATVEIIPLGGGVLSV